MEKLIVCSSLRIKKCTIEECSGSLIAHKLEFSKPNGKQIYISCKKCDECGMLYMDVGTYTTMKYKDSFQVLNSEPQIKIMAETRRRQWWQKQYSKNSCVGGSHSLDEKRYINGGLERSFTIIDINNLKTK